MIRWDEFFEGLLGQPGYMLGIKRPDAEALKAEFKKRIPLLISEQVPPDTVALMSDGKVVAVHGLAPMADWEVRLNQHPAPPSAAEHKLRNQLHASMLTTSELILAAQHLLDCEVHGRTVGMCAECRDAEVTLREAREANQRLIQERHSA